MKRTPLRPSSSPIRANRTRKAKEFARCFHSKARVEWVKSRPCVVPGCITSGTRIENMHIKGDGIGRRASYKEIVTACWCHHSLAHSYGIEWFQEEYGVDLAACAARTQAAWLEHTA